MPHLPRNLETDFSEQLRHFFKLSAKALNRGMFKCREGAALELTRELSAPPQMVC